MDDQYTKITSAIQSQIDFAEQLSRCYVAAAEAFPERAEFFASIAMAKQTCANLFANILQDFEENQPHYRLERDLSGSFINLCQKNRNNYSLLEARKLGDEEFIQYSRSVEAALSQHVASPIIVGTTPAFLKISKIIDKIQMDQIRLFNGLAHIQHIPA